VHFAYGPYGEILQSTGGTESTHRRRFNDKYKDELTGLSYYGARFYDPVSMTWISADPAFRFAPDAAWNEPRRANLYTFVLGNPLSGIDPDGRDTTILSRISNAPEPSPITKLQVKNSSCGETRANIANFVDDKFGQSVRIIGSITPIGRAVDKGLTIMSGGCESMADVARAASSPGDDGTVDFSMNAPVGPPGGGGGSGGGVPGGTGAGGGKEAEEENARRPEKLRPPERAAQARRHQSHRQTSCRPCTPLKTHPPPRLKGIVYASWAQRRSTRMATGFRRTRRGNRSILEPASHRATVREPRPVRGRTFRCRRRRTRRRNDGTKITRKVPAYYRRPRSKS
jgi:RHS repeat-associated protein